MLAINPPSIVRIVLSEPLFDNLTDLILKTGYNLLHEAAAMINAAGGIHCTVDTEGIIKEFEPRKTLLIYRIAQETLHNVTKHAKATELRILLGYGIDDFVMQIADNGIGFIQTGFSKENGMGLHTIKQRAFLLNGDLDLITSPGNGCLITLTILDKNKMADFA